MVTLPGYSMETSRECMAGAQHGGVHLPSEHLGELRQEDCCKVPNNLIYIAGPVAAFPSR